MKKYFIRENNEQNYLDALESYEIGIGQSLSDIFLENGYSTLKEAMDSLHDGIVNESWEEGSEVFSIEIKNNRTIVFKSVKKQRMAKKNTKFLEKLSSISEKENV